MQERGTEKASAPETQQPTVASLGIVSVNSRGGKSDGLLGKAIFVVAILALLVIGTLMSFNKWRAGSKAEQAAAEQQAKLENKPATVGGRRIFDTDPPPLPGLTQVKLTDAAGEAHTCTDGTAGIVMLGQDGKPLLAPGGAPMRVCSDGRVLVPAVAPVAMAGGRPGMAPHQGGAPGNSRYGGDVIVAAPNAGMASRHAGAAGALNDPVTAAIMQSLLGQSQALPGAQERGLFGAPGQSPGAGVAAGPQQAPASPPGSLGNQLTPSQTPSVQASMIGDRSLMLPKGRTIECGLSMRLVNEVAGMASCVLPQNVYSDNGRVLLLERGSEATGEYVAAMAQGQRRLFVLWTRIKTPGGVVINLNSPAADSLGTSGLDGYVDNRWWERIGAAFMLSLVQDAIAYQTAREASEDGVEGVAVFQNSKESAGNFAEKVLASTINIKPTLYKNQGDRASIYVARDLDFGTVYALRAR